MFATNSSGPAKRVLSPGNKALLVKELPDLSPANKKRTTTVLTPDNANVLLQNAFDLESLSAALLADSDIVKDTTQLFNLLTECVVDQSVLPFTSVSKRHLKLLGLDVSHRMSLHPDLAEAANASDSPSNTVWKAEASGQLQRHFDVSIESGCRCLIDQYILAAVVYAQQTIAQDADLTSTLRQTYRIMNPHIAVFTEQPVPDTVITSDDTSYTFYGSLEYALGYISEDDITSLGRGSLSLDTHEALCGIVVVQSLSEMHNAIPQITAQVLSLLVLTGRTTFTCALTNGTLWRFFTAHSRNSSLQIFMSAEFESGRDNGVIIELLKDMILFTKSPVVATDFNQEVVYR